MWMFFASFCERTEIHLCCIIIILEFELFVQAVEATVQEEKVAKAELFAVSAGFSREKIQESQVNIRARFIKLISLLHGEN